MFIYCEHIQDMRHAFLAGDTLADLRPAFNYFLQLRPAISRIPSR